MSATIVYTSILDGYDDLPTFSKIDNKIRYVCFSNRQIDTKRRPFWEISNKNRQYWEIVIIDSYFVDRKITNGYLKANSHVLFGNDVISLWIDGNLRDVNVDASEMADMIKDSPVATLAHQVRSSIFEEIDEVVRLNLEHPSTAARWRQCVEESGYVDGSPLTATMMLCRDHRNPAVRRANESWWERISSGVRRDQLSFNHALWENGVVPSYLDADWRVPNRFFSRVNHKNDSGRNLSEKMKLSLLSHGAALDMPSMPESYPEDVNYTNESWTVRELGVLRNINCIVNKTRDAGEVVGNYCHFHGAKLAEFTPPDLRRSWKREYLRRAVRGARRGVEVGFNAGHGAIIMLEAEPLLQLTSIDNCNHSYTVACAESLETMYNGRFGFVRGCSKDFLGKIGVENIDFVHIDGGHDLRSLQFNLDWFCHRAPKGCKLMVDDAYGQNIRSLIESKVQKKLLRRAYCGFPTSEENILYERS